MSVVIILVFVAILMAGAFLGVFHLVGKKRSI